jgi:hypothetical protein
VLLVAEPGQPLQFRSCRLRPWDRIAARCLVGSLDRQLAEGRPADVNPRRAARARHLVEPAQRETLARNWEHLIQVAGSTPWPAHRLDPRPPVPADEFAAAGPELAQMLSRLRAPLPVPVRGVALAQVLLTDGTGPAYNRGFPVALARAVREAVLYMDPATDLLQLAGAG